MRHALKFDWLLLLGMLLGSVGAYAQEPTEVTTEVTTAAAPTANATTSNEVGNAGETTGPASSLPTPPWQSVAESRPVAPDVYLLPDESGKLRKVLGFRYEDFFEAWQHDESDVVVAPPRYVLDALEVSGEVLQTNAQLRLEFEITLQATNWIAIPIQLPDFIVQQSTIDGQTEGECLVYDKPSHGHVVWLTGQAGQKRKLVVEGLAKLQLSTGSHGIELNLPRATTSQFKLRLPDSNTRFESSPELALTTVALENNKIEVRLLGQANPLRLNWAPEDEDAANQAAVIEVEGKTIVHLDRRRASYDTTLKINSFATPIEQFQVRLPGGAKLNLGETSSEYKIQVLGASASRNRRQVVEIRLPEPRQKPLEIRLSAESPLVALSDSAEWTIEGFEVLSAIRQSGTLTLEVDDQLQAYFDTHGDIDQAPLKEVESTPEGRSVLGRFRYARFPWKLVVFTSPRQKRVSVKPQYGLSISSEEARLDVQYDYQLTGAQIFSQRVNLQGWEMTDAPIESGGLINSEGVVATREGHLMLPLVNPDTQQLRLKLSLRKDIELGDNTFLLPQPMGAFVVDGVLSVDASDALLVIPKLGEMSGLSLIGAADRNLSAAANPSATGQNDAFRFRSFLSQIKFVAVVTQRQRQVVAVARTQVGIDQQVIRVQQRLDYQSKYQPVSQLSINLPEQLIDNDSLTVTLDGQQLPFGPGAAVDDESIALRLRGSDSKLAAQRTIIVSLPRPIQNAIPIEIAYEMPAPDFTIDELTPLLLPLATPQDTLSSHEVVINAASPILVTTNQRSASDKWQVITPDSPEEEPATNSEPTQLDQSEGMATDDMAAALQLQTNENLPYLSLYAQLDSADKVQLATLERAWIQTWITHGQRQERAVFRFRSPHSIVFAQIPADVNDSEIEVLLDGMPWEYELLADNRLAIELPSNGRHTSAGLASAGLASAGLASAGLDSAGLASVGLASVGSASVGSASTGLASSGQLDSRSLELRYQQKTTLPSWGELHCTLPRLECRSASAPIYWQLILPRGWQLLTSPQQLVADYWLGWKNYRWGRQPTLSQVDLEQHMGAVFAIAPSPISSQYVYRAFEIPGEIQVVVIRQSWLFAACAIAAFGIGLLYLYTSLAQHGVFWLGLSLALLVGIFSYPEVALLAIEVILAGGLMTFVTSVLRHTFMDSDDSRVTGMNYQLEPPTEITETWQRRQQGGRPETAETTATLRTSEPLP